MKNVILFILLAFAFTFVSCEKSAQSAYIGTYNATLTQGAVGNEDGTMEISQRHNGLQVDVSDNIGLLVSLEVDDSLNVIPCFCYNGSGEVIDGKLTTLPDGKVQLWFRRRSSGGNIYRINVTEK